MWLKIWDEGKSAFVGRVHLDKVVAITCNSDDGDSTFFLNASTDDGGGVRLSDNTFGTRQAGVDAINEMLGV